MARSVLSRGLGAAGLIVAAAAMAHTPALAGSATRTVTTNDGRTFSITRSASFDRSTRTATRTQSVTGPNGKTATASISSAPDGRGGFTISRSSTGFNGQTHSSSVTRGR